MPLPPYADPGQPAVRGPMRYLWWLLARQPGRVGLAGIWSCLWMLALAAEPYLIRGAIDNGLLAADRDALLRWGAATATVGALASGLGVLRHRTMTFLRMDAAYRTVQVVSRHAARLGAAVPRRVATGEVVTVGTTDIWHVARVLTIAGPGVASVVTVVVIGGVLITISPPLGLLVIVGVPAVTLVVGPLLGRLAGAERAYRQQQGELTAQAGDVVAGLRVLRGIGGEELFARRYRRRSGELLRAGYLVGRSRSWIRALSAALPATFVGLVTWLAARDVARGVLSIGDLVAVSAYAAVLALPVFFFIEGASDLVRGRVAARRIIALLRLAPEVGDGGAPVVPAPRGAPAALRDPDSGLVVPAGLLTAVATADTGAAAALADRLGRYVESDVTWGGVRLAELPLPEVRRRILVADGDAYLFAGVLRDLLTPVREVDDARIARCLRAASADDIVAGLPDGLHTRLGAQARTLSGGQRQRMRLARALLADPEVLILVDPTSAVDAHTEAAIADRLRSLRHGRTTLVVTTSPLLLDRADRAVLLVDGAVAAEGSHPELLSGSPAYRELVGRGAEPPAGPVPAGPRVTPAGPGNPR